MSSEPPSYFPPEMKERFKNMPPEMQEKMKEKFKNGPPSEMKGRKPPFGRPGAMGDEGPVDPAKAKAQMRNLQIMVLIMCSVMLSVSIYGVAFMQWVYVYFEEQALGDDFYKLNITAAADPCFRSAGNATGMTRSSPYAKELAQAQANAARFNVYNSLVDVIPSVLANLLIGAYSDRLGRRFIFITFLSGGLIRTGLVCAVAYFKLNIYIILAGSFISGMCGDINALFTGISTYTSDNTTARNRAIAMVLMQTAMMLTANVARILNGYYILAVGYVWPMITGFCLYCMAFLICIFFLRETLDKSKVKKSSLWGTSDYCKPAGYKSQINNRDIKSVFSFYLLKPPNPFHRRSDFIIIALVMVVFAASSSDQITTIFLMGQPLCWSSTRQSWVMSITGIVTSLGSAMILAVLKRHLSDELVAIICIASSTAKNILFSFADTDFGVYAALGAGILETGVLALIRSVQSKLVKPENRGSLFASTAVINVVVTAAANAGLNNLYAVTVSEWRGMTFFVVGVLSAAAGLLMIFYKVIISQRDVPETESDGHAMKGFTVDSSTWTGEDNDAYDEKL